MGLAEARPNNLVKKIALTKGYREVTANACLTITWFGVRRKYALSWCQRFSAVPERTRKESKIQQEFIQRDYDCFD